MDRSARGQLSLRPSASTLERLERRSRIAQRPKTNLAERYLDEGLVMDDFPHIHFVDGALGRRPAMVGTGLDVWEVVKAIKDSGSIDETAAYLEIDPRLVVEAAAYYGENKSEVDAWLERIHVISHRERRKWQAAHDVTQE